MGEGTEGGREAGRGGGVGREDLLDLRGETGWLQPPRSFCNYLLSSSAGVCQDAAGALGLARDRCPSQRGRALSLQQPGWVGVWMDGWVGGMGNGKRG